MGMNLGASFGAGAASDARLDLQQVLFDRLMRERQIRLQEQNATEQMKWRQMQQESLDEYRTGMLADRKAQIAEKEADNARAATIEAVKTLPSGWEGAPEDVAEWTKAVPQLKGVFRTEPRQMGTTVAAGIPLPMLKARSTFTGVGKETPEQIEARQRRMKEEDVARDRETHRQNRVFDAQHPVAGGPVIKVDTVDEDGNPVTRVMARGDAMGQSFEKGPTAAQRQQNQAYRRAEPVINSISELSERINTQRGVVATLRGSVERAKAQANLSDDVAEYTALVSGFTPLIARAVGHVGVLTEQDVQSVRQLFPAPEDSKSVRDRKMARLKKIMTEVEDVPANPSAKGGNPAPDEAAAPKKRTRYDLNGNPIKD